MLGSGKGMVELEDLIIVLFVLSVGYLGGVVSTYSLTGLGEETVFNPTYNLSCPEPVRRIDSNVDLNYQPGEKSFIQAPYTDVSYSQTDEELTVEEVDATAQPEGMSMRPTIFTGNTVLMSEYSAGPISEGQILRYETEEGDPVIHRVQANYLGTGDYLLMRGDNNEESSRIERSQVTHRVLGILYSEENPGYASFSD